MLLVVDIGNTNICFGVFNDDVLEKVLKVSTDLSLTVEQYQDIVCGLFNNYKINHCIIASVVKNLDETLKKACDNVFDINSLIFDNNLNTGVSIAVENPQTVGVDRIANTYAAMKLYDIPAIIVDSGSATTFDIVSADGEFIGGVIIPGLELQFKSLSKDTSKLPEIAINHSEKVIGNSTEKAILSGVIRGSAAAIDGLIVQCKSELNQDCMVIGTGGGIEILAKYMSTDFDEINPNLTLFGLKYLYQLNVLRT